MASIIGVETLQHTNGTTAATIDSSGRIKQPAKPMFAAKGKTSGAGYVTTSPMVFPNEDFDVGGMYDDSTGVVTIPVDGKYRVDVMVYCRVDSGEDMYPRLQVSTDGGSNWSHETYSYIYNNAGTQIHDTRSINAILDLNANDQVRIIRGGSGDYYDGSQEHRFAMELVG